MQDACVRARLGRAFFTSLAILLLVITHAAHAGVSYAYDDLGRVTQATYTDGSIVQYQYDANGNIVAINRLQTSALSIASFTPLIGQASSVVTVTGSGFSPTRANNHVTVGGATAVVNSATPTQLVITVPMNAQTGVIGLTVGASSTASAQQFVVRRPVITSFSPAIVNPGATITVIGSNFTLAPPAATVTIGGLAATVTSVTNTKIVFTAPANTGGPIEITTSYGQVTSSSVLTVIPSFIPASEIGAATTMALGGAPVSATNSQANKRGAISFDAVAGQYLSLQASGIASNPPGVVPTFYLFAPSGAQIASGSIPAGAPTTHFAPMPVTGRYLLVFAPGNATFQFDAALELNTVVSNTTVSALSAATAASSQTKRFLINAGAGQHISIGLTHLTMTGASSINLAIYRPSGAILWNRDCFVSSPVSSCGLSPTDVPDTGTYQLIATPNGAATMTFDLTVSPAVIGTLPSGTPTTVNMTQPAQLASYSFTATAGQAFTLSVDSIATVPPGQAVYMSLRGPNGEITNRNMTDGVVLNYLNVAAGNYRVDLVPTFGLTGSARLRLALATPPSLPTNGTATSLSTTLPGQYAYYTFSGSAGQMLGVALSSLTMSAGNSVQVKVFRPSGAYTLMNVGTGDPGAGNHIDFFGLPETGTYIIEVVPNANATMSFDITISPPVTASLTAGTPQTVNLTSRGQFGLVTFTATAGQAATIQIGSISTTPASAQNVYFGVIDPNGNEVANATNNGGTSISLTSLMAGTYTVRFLPWWAMKASAQFTLTSIPSTPLPTNGTVTHYSTSTQGEFAYFTFEGTAGQALGIGLSGLSTSNGQQVGVTVKAPNGTVLATMNDAPWNPGGGNMIDLLSLPQAGTYSITVTPDGGTMSFDITVSPPVPGTLAFGVSQGVTIASPGQFTALTFTNSATQSRSVNVSAFSTTPGGQTASFGVYAANGAELAFTTVSSNATLNLNNLPAGTYTVRITPWWAAKASAQVLVQ